MKNFRKSIKEQFRTANDSIRIAVGLFTDEKLIKALKLHSEKGIKVELIMSKTEWNLIRLVEFKKLRKAGGLIRVFGEADFTEMDFLNNNCCIIDGLMTIEGPPEFSENFMDLKAEMKVDGNLAWAEELLSEFEELINQSEDYFTFHKEPEKISRKLQILEEKGLGPKEYQFVKNDPMLKAALAMLEL